MSTNAYGWIVLAALCADYALNLVADLLNARAMRAEVPPELADVYDTERYRQSQAYTQARARFALLPRTFDLLLVLGFWFLGGFAWLDGAVRSFELGSVTTGLLFLGALLGGRSILHLPFRLYATFVLEERFGFNRTNWKTFVSDMIKGTLLAIALGAPLGAAVLFLFEAAGDEAWLYCWGLVAAFILLVQFVAPSWLMPLFMKFTPLEQGELRERILTYARSVAFPLENLFVVDGSRRSTKANAFFTGFGKHRRIGLFDTLLARYSPDELVAVVAHEVGHYKKRHVQNSMFLSIAQLGVLLFLFGLFMRQEALYAAFFVPEASVYTGLVFCSMLYEPLSLVLSLWLLWRSRKHEYEADRFAVETTGLADALITGLKKLSADSLGNLTPHPSYVLLHHTHPPLRERLQAIRKAAAERLTTD